MKEREATTSVIDSVRTGPDAQLDDPGRGRPTGNLRTDVLTLQARRGAQHLPDRVTWGLLTAYCAFTRGSEISYSSSESHEESLRLLVAERDTLQDAKQRELHLSDEQMWSDQLENIGYLLQANPRMTFKVAWRSHLDQMTRDNLNLATAESLDESWNLLQTKLLEWLRDHHIPFTTKRPIHLSSARLTQLLQPFKGLPDFHVAPDIPGEKLNNVIDELWLDELDTPVGLVDCTFWGSSKKCVAFGGRGVYFTNDEGSGYLPYSDFPDRTFVLTNDRNVGLGRGLSISLAGSGISIDAFLAMLNAIKKEAIAREGGSDTVNILETGGDGLAALAGMQELKEMLTEEVIAPLRDPGKYKKYGIGIPNGILMFGPPGCGKTFVAERLAAELGYRFFQVAPSEIGSSFVHGSTLKIKELFDAAARTAPAMMFVDEFDGLVPARASLGGEQQHKAEEVNEWLVQIGSSASRNILFVAATNEPWAIDPAIQRSGRLDKKIYIGPPDEGAIAEMLLYHLRGRHTVKDIDARPFAEEIADQGYSASDLKLLVDEAAKLAMRSDEHISHQHLILAALHKVPPSISMDLQQIYKQFANKGNS